MIEDYIKDRKVFIVYSGVLLLIGAILGTGLIWIFLILGVGYLILKKKGYIKNKDEKDSEMS